MSLPRVPPVGWAVLLALLIFHGVSGAWAWQAGWVDGPFEAWLGVRSLKLRILLGGQYLPLVADGSWWRLAASGWVHADGLHLAVNGVALVVLAQLLVPLVGNVRWLGILLLGVWAGSWVSHLSGIPQSDGASGGAFALLGAGTAVGLRWPDVAPVDRALLVRGLGAVALLNVALSLAVPLLDVAAHVGGWAGGLLAGGVLVREGRVWPWGVASGATLAVVVLGLCGVLGR